MSVDAGRLVRNPALVIGIVGTILLLLVGVFGAAVAPQDPNAQHWILEGFDANGNPATIFPPSTPDAAHPLGTDQLGRDQLSRLLVGARTTLMVVLTAAIARLGVGVALGIAGGWYGALLGAGVRTLTATFTAIPQLLLAILFVLVLRPYGIVGFIVAMALVGWPAVAEFVRGEVARAKATPFMEAARSIGARDRSLVRRHLLTALAPELLTLAALETGGVLLLLAELGLIGLFLAGATYYLNETGGPVLPLRDRAPEWGQMLGGIQFYAAQDQIVVLVPALVIVLAAVVFTLLADGLRIAGDPFSTRRLLPSTYGVIAKALGGVLCVSAVAFVGFNVRPAPITLAEGQAIASETAARAWPGSEYVAGVARYSSLVHGMERPEKLTYYFRNSSGEVLRISFQNADRLAMDVREYESEDEIDFATLQPLTTTVADYAPVLAKADQSGGTRFRIGAPSYLVRVILTWPVDRPAPMYLVTYGTHEPRQQALVRFCCYDAASGEFIPPSRARAAPFAIPASCAAQTLVPGPFFDARGVVFGGPGGTPVAWYRIVTGTSTAPVLGAFTNLLYQGDNGVIVQNAPSPPRIVSAVNLSGRAGGVEFVRVGIASTNAYDATLRFDTPGCWKLRLAAGDASLDVTVYAYPGDCRPPDAAALPGDSSPCQP